MSSEPDSAELQEAVSKTTFTHEFTNLDPATTYSIYLKAYSALGGSQQSGTITSTTQGGGMLHSCLPFKPEPGQILVPEGARSIFKHLLYFYTLL